MDIHFLELFASGKLYILENVRYLQLLDICSELKTIQVKIFEKEFRLSLELDLFESLSFFLILVFYCILKISFRLYFSCLRLLKLRLQSSTESKPRLIFEKKIEKWCG